MLSVPTAYSDILTSGYGYVMFKDNNLKILSDFFAQANVAINENIKTKNADLVATVSEENGRTLDVMMLKSFFKDALMFEVTRGSNKQYLSAPQELQNFVCGKLG